MYRTQPKFLRFLRDVDSLMLRTKFPRVVLQITIHTKMGLFSYAVEFGLVGRYFGAVVTERMLGLLLFVGIDGEIYEVAGIDLVVFEDHVFMEKNLWALLLAV